VAVIHGDRQLDWGEVYARCRRLASALKARGILAGDTIAFMLDHAEAKALITDREFSACIEHCRGRMARFKVPRRVVFGPLPKTSTGKIQKYILREQVKSASAIES